MLVTGISLRSLPTRTRMGAASEGAVAPGFAVVAAGAGASAFSLSPPHEASATPLAPPVTKTQASMTSERMRMVQPYGLGRRGARAPKQPSSSCKEPRPGGVPWRAP